MICASCGVEIPDDSNFCVECGAAVNKQTDSGGGDNPDNTEQVVSDDAVKEEVQMETDDRVYEKLCDLEELFKKRIAYDEHKNELFDKLYDDKKKYENDIVASITDPILIEIIQVIEELRAQIAKLPEESSQENYEKLLKKFKDIPLRLEDVLYDHDVEPYEVSGDVPDTKQQKVVRVVETEDRDLSGKIAERLTCGYKKGNKIIRSERINVYKVIKEEE